MDEYKVRITEQAKGHLNLIKSYLTLKIKEPETAKKMLLMMGHIFIRTDSAGNIKADQEKSTKKDGRSHCYHHGTG